MTERSEAHVRELLDAARAVYGEFALGHGFSAGSCAAAIRAGSGKIYTGICIDVACGMGFCAEHAAVAEMLKARETQIVAVVAVARDAVAPPCGRCRELMVQVDARNVDAMVLLDGGREALLGELLPERWL